MSEKFVNIDGELDLFLQTRSSKVTQISTLTLNPSGDKLDEYVFLITPFSLNKSPPSVDVTKVTQAGGGRWSWNTEATEKFEIDLVYSKIKPGVY